MHPVATGDMCIQHPPAAASAPAVEQVPWDKRLDMRSVTLANFPFSSSAYRHHYRSQNNLIARSKSHVISCPRKSLTALRVSLQKSLNQELHSVLEKYITNFFRPAAANISRNNGNVQISEYHLQEVCRQMLEEAKKMYHVGSNQLSSALNDLPDKSTHNNASNCSSKRPASSFTKSNNTGSSVNDDDSSSCTASKRAKVSKKVSKKNGVLNKNHSNESGSGNKTDFIDCTGPRWDPLRLNTDTLFVLGSRANVALGYVNMRGKMYNRHRDLFRYIGDSDDKQWLTERGFMPPSGGRAYLIVKKDVEDLLESDVYKNAPGVSPLDMGDGFTVPDFMIQKMRQLMAESRDKSIAMRKRLPNTPGKL